MIKETFSEKFKEKMISVGRKGPSDVFNNIFPLPFVENVKEKRKNDIIEFNQLKCKNDNRTHNYNENYTHQPFMNKNLSYQKCEYKEYDIDVSDKKINIHNIENVINIPKSSAQVLKNENLSHNSNNRDVYIKPDSLDDHTSDKVGVKKQDIEIAKKWKKENLIYGGLGPNYCEDWEKKKINKDKQNMYGQIVRELNLKKLSFVPSHFLLKENKQQEAQNNYLRAKEFSKTVPKPKCKKQSLPKGKEITYPSTKSNLEEFETKHQDLQNLIRKIK